jgi:prolyl 4-hydroxylase
MAGSTVGNRDGGGSRRSETRTSRNAWVARDSSPVIDTIYRRAADLLNIDEKLLISHKNAEDMQVVHYELGQKYDSHHDWGVSGYPESRFITLLLYLTDQLHPNAGGETAFPKGLNGRGFKVHPGKGSAVLFYNLLEDGNGDDLALHAALPVLEGNKSLANFWIWDAKRKS